MTYWSSRRRTNRRQSVDIYPMFHSATEFPRSARSTTKIGWRSPAAEPADETFRAILQFDPHALTEN
jgi:hypothetical protein